MINQLIYPLSNNRKKTWFFSVYDMQLIGAEINIAFPLISPISSCLETTSDHKNWFSSRSGPPCQNTPCRNGGTCSEDSRGDFSCSCKPGFTGNLCESQLGVRLCEQNPCRNDGVCLALIDSEYRCECQPGWTGKNCETNINDCAPNPCKNGGICIDGLNNYTCVCDRTGYVFYENVKLKFKS